MVHSPLEKKEDLFSNLQRPSITTVYSLVLWMDTHNCLFSPPHQTSQVHSVVLPMLLSSRQMLTCSPSLMPVGIKYRGFCLLGSIPSSAIPCHHLSQSRSPLSWILVKAS